MKEETINLKGVVTFSVYDDSGRLLRTFSDNNLVTDVGKNYIVRRVISDASVAGSAISQLYIGDDSSSPASESNIELNNTVAQVNIDSIDDSNNVAEFSTTIPVGVATGTIGEVGLVTNDPNPILVSHIVLSTSFTKGSNESIRVNWQLKIGNN